MYRLIALLCLFATSSSADPMPLKALSAYINGLGSAQTQFTQYNGDGSRSTGTLYIQRPGRMKFEYDPPNEALVLASAGVIAIFDAKSNAEPQQFPLKRTPLNLILGSNIDLSNADMVANHYQAENGMTVVEARDPKNPASGWIELYFSPDPTALTQWVITDEAGTTTGIAIGPLDVSVKFPSWFFSVNREAELRSR